MRIIEDYLLKAKAGLMFLFDSPSFALIENAPLSHGFHLAIDG